MTLTLVRCSRGAFLKSSGGPELRYYDCAGDGGQVGRIPFTSENEVYRPIDGVETASYEADDAESFRSALLAVLASARAAGVELPPYALV